MNYTPAQRGHTFKTPLSTNDLNPTFVNHSTDTTNNRKIDPAVLNRIRDLSQGTESTTTVSTNMRPANPFRAKTGLMFRDILGRTDNTRSCSSCRSNIK